MEFVMDNVVGTTNLLDYARLYTQDSLKMFLYFSTDEVFGSAPVGTNYKEWDRYNSGNPYSASKAGAEEMCLAYFNTYKVPVVITHTMNVFGIRQHPEKYIPLVIKKVRDGELVTIHSNAEKTKAGSRFYINTEDVASAMKFILQNHKLGDKYNIVGEREVDNLQLAQIIADIMGKKLNYEMLDFHSSRPGHDLRYALCGEKMKSMGWEPEKKLEDRLEEVISWTLDNSNRWLL
jgi:dTDP-glucose 4,6-dehydratase